MLNENQKKKISVYVGDPVMTRYGIRIKNKPYVSLDGARSSIIESLQKLKEKYSDEYSNLRIDYIRDCGCYHLCDCSLEPVLKGDRYETEIELEFRLKKEAEKKAEETKREKAELERLKKKYE
jgi:hypothetical protein